MNTPSIETKRIRSEINSLRKQSWAGLVRSPIPLDAIGAWTAFELTYKRLLELEPEGPSFESVGRELLDDIREARREVRLRERGPDDDGSDPEFDHAEAILLR